MATNYDSPEEKAKLYGQVGAIQEQMQAQRARAKPKPATSNQSKELQSGLGELGINFSGGREYDDPEDPWAWNGTKRVKLSKLINRFYVLTDKELRRFQDQAVRAGLIDKEDLRPGAYDDTTFNIWKSAAFQSAGFQAGRKNKSPWEALDAVAAATPQGFGDKDKAPPSATVSNPADIKVNLKKAATAVLGRGITDETLERLTVEFQALQEQAQLAQGAAARSGGTSVSAPEFGTFAEQELREVDPLRADAKKKLKAAQVIQGLMTADPVEQVMG